MFTEINDYFGESIIVATFGDGTISMYPAITDEDTHVLLLRDSCEKATKTGEEIPGGEIPWEGTRVSLEFKTVESLDVLVSQLMIVRDYIERGLTNEELRKECA